MIGKRQRPAEAIERSSDTNLATGRVLRVLAQFADAESPFGVTELAARLDMSKNMVFRALSTLVDQGYLVRSADGRRYELGFRAIELADADAPEPDLREIARPCMVAMQALTGETVVLTLRVNDAVVVIDGIEPPDQSMRTRAPIGSRFPLHASPGARAVLAAMSDPQIEQYLQCNVPLRRFTSATLTDPRLLRKDVKATRTRGHAIGFGDATVGRRSVAWAIIDAEGLPWGAIVVGGPAERFTATELDRCLPELQRLAQSLNARARLFHAGPPGPLAE